MHPLSTAVALVWILMCLAVIAIGAPTLTLAQVAGPGVARRHAGSALVWTWLMVTVLVPVSSAVHGFNWVTALLMAAAPPMAVWWFHHRGHARTAFRHVVRRLVFRALEPRWTVSRRTQVRMASGTALLLVTLACLVVKEVDVRLPVPADFDTFSRTRQLLEGGITLDPLASMAAVLTRVAAADTLSVLVALRLALLALTVAAAGMLLVESFGRPAAIVVAPLSLVVVVPLAPLATLAVVLVLLIGTTSLLRWCRSGCRTDGWNLAAASLLVMCHLAPFSDRPQVLVRVERAAHHLEHRAAAQQALWLAGQPSDADWVLVGPPEQRLEIHGRGRFVDLADFVARFHPHAANAGFRFTLGADRLFVMVEKRALNVSRPAQGIRFVEAQPPAYRVPQERELLQEMAMALCERYRATHIGAAIVYDDADLRIYRFDV